jgi:2,3-dihydroxybiphenyl 1,2-dioxygenase
MITQLGYVGIVASNIENWARFATEILGLQISERDANGPLYLRMDENHYRIIIHPGIDDDLAYVGWQVRDAEALQAAAANLQLANVPFQHGTADELGRRRVLGLLKFSDPNGDAVELFYGPAVTSENRFRPGRAIAGFKTGPLGVGHVTLATSGELKPSTDFYRNVLGFRVSDYATLGEAGNPNAVFLRCNPRHHSLAIIKTSKPTKKLLHLLLELESIDDVGTVLDECYRNRIEVSRSLGRHSNDRMISCYIKSPSGFDIEYGWGGRLVDDSTWAVEQHAVSRAWGAQTAAEELERARDLLFLSEGL